jgi:hypothetical protein
MLKVRQNNTGNASFKSNTGRSMEQHIQRHQKLNYPDMNAYTSEVNNIGTLKIEGGAPNNFLLMKNDR